MTEKWEFTQREAARSMLANYKLGIADSWIKALTELVTNSHQNYHDMIDDPAYVISEKPTIVIIANSVAETFTVLDHGTGIAGTGKELETLLMDYSAYIQKSHTPKGRSSFGRGMSDVLFRKKEYTNSLIAIKNGNCIAAKAHWTDKGPTFSQDTTLTEKQILAELGEHGTSVTFNWNSNIEPQNFPTKKSILDSLSKYYELKTVLNDTEVDVILLYLDGKQTPEPKKLEFINADKNATLIDTVTDIQLDIDPKYDIRIISANIFRSKIPLNQERGESRTGGLFVEGEHGQIFDLTLFDHEKNYRTAALRIIGDVILSEDAKRYMDDFYTKHGETVLTRTREGFSGKTKFYKELKKKLETWLVNILEKESETSSSSASDKFSDAIKMLNDIAKKLLDVKNLEPDPSVIGGCQTGPPPPPPPPPLPDTIQFSPESPKIEQGVTCKISLKINAERIKPGTKIYFTKEGKDRNHYTIEYDATTVPKSTKGLSKIPILIKCNELQAQAEIKAVTKLSNGQKVEKWCALDCVPERIIGPPVTEYLEFAPKKTSVETNVDKRINLYAKQILDPGTKIKLEFTSDREEPPITFAEDGNRVITTRSHTFEIEVPNITPNKDAYRIIPLTFTATEDSFEGKLTASVVDTRVVPTTCEIIIENPNESANGLISGFKFENEPDYPMYAWYEADDTKVHINLAIPIVKSILGKNKEEAETRCDELQEAQVFVATAMMEAFFDDVVARLYESRKEIFDQPDPSYKEAHDQMFKKRQELVSEFGQPILQSIAPNVRTKTSGGKVTQMDFKTEGISLKLWDLELKKDVIPPISFNELKEFRGNPANLSVIHFEIPGQVFEVGLYQFENDSSVCCLHNFDKDGKYGTIMTEINDMKQIFKPSKTIPSSITIDNPVFSPVKISTWAGKPDKRLKVIALRYDQYGMIPNPPTPNHSNILLENSPDWITDSGESLVEYTKYSSMLKNHKFKNNLVSFVSKDNARQMAKMFVRTRVIPAFDCYNEIVKSFKDITAKCQNSNCNEEATGSDEILTKFGVMFTENTPHVKENCKHCS